MENELIEDWINSNRINHYDYGDGEGCGSGYNRGSGCGWRYSYCSYSSDGDRDGRGYCYGYGYGIEYCDGSGSGKGYYECLSKFNEYNVYRIDGINTIITNTIGNIAKGFILRKDYTLEKCYIAKQDGLFGRGFRIKKAKGILNLRLRKLEELQGDKNE